MTETNGFDFDTPVDRTGTSSEKWRMFEDKGVLPMWLADMDFRSPPAVIRALRERAEHGVFGYTGVPSDLVDCVLTMLEAEYGWRVEPDWIVWLPGLVCGLNVSCRAVGRDGDEVLTTVPVYPPFLSAPANSRRVLRTAPLAQSNRKWTPDYDAIEAAITPRTQLFMLCSPHNPAGRVFTREELTRLANICERRDLIICSDEIHCGLILDRDARHIPTASLDPEIARRTITLMSPSKTFNLPGVGCAFAIVPDATIRKEFRRACKGIVPPITAFGFEAALAAYRECEEWRQDLIAYLRNNRATLERAVAEIPGISMAHVEATYLAWIDVRESGLDQPVKQFASAGLGLADGIMFGGPGFVRLAFGCPRSVLLRGVELMRNALKGDFTPVTDDPGSVHPAW